MRGSASHGASDSQSPPSCYSKKAEKCCVTTPKEANGFRSPLNNGAIIGTGRTADVLSWGEGRVLKHFQPGRPAAKVEREFMVTRAAKAAGLPVPAAYELVAVEGRLGIVFERIEGVTMLKQFQSQPWKLFAATRLVAELHAQVHGWPAPPEIPPLRLRIEARIEDAQGLSEADKQIARRCLDRLPEGDALCHGDFHPDNILLTASGPVIIDWGGGSRGDPLADVAQTIVLIQKESLPSETPLPLRALVSVSRALMHAVYQRHYLKLRPGTAQRIEAWRLLLLATSSCEVKNDERHSLLARLEAAVDRLPR